MVSTPILFATIAITRGKLHEINHDLSRLPTPEPLSRSSTSLSSFSFDAIMPSTNFSFHSFRSFLFPQTSMNRFEFGSVN